MLFNYLIRRMGIVGADQCVCPPSGAHAGAPLQTPCFTPSLIVKLHENLFENSILNRQDAVVEYNATPSKKEKLNRRDTENTEKRGEKPLSANVASCIIKQVLMLFNKLVCPVSGAHVGAPLRNCPYLIVKLHLRAYNARHRQFKTASVHNSERMRKVSDKDNLSCE